MLKAINLRGLSSLERRLLALCARSLEVMFGSGPVARHIERACHRLAARGFLERVPSDHATRPGGYLVTDLGCRAADILEVRPC